MKFAESLAVLVNSINWQHFENAPMPMEDQNKNFNYYR
jgi:hypothetical protein